MADPRPKAPVTYYASVERAANELDYRDMVALSGMFRRWAIYDTAATPEVATELIMHSADLERIAEWVGPGWRAAAPSDEPDLFVDMAMIERRHPNITKLPTARRRRSAW